MEEKETIQPIEITWEELQSRDLERYILVDTRGDEAVNYGMIPGAIAIPECELVDKLAAAAGDKKVILYCSRGQNSKVSAEYFREQGMDVYSLQGGYTGWLLNLMQKEQPGEKENERAREIEKSIRKKFHKVLFSRFAKAINEYDMIQENDKIAVCISGGKDSMLMAKLFQELKRHNKFPFELVFLVMDPGYSEANRKIIENNAKLMDIPITIFESQIFDAVYDIEDSPCYLCARMRRGYLYSHAKELGCNKIALGHHYDDVIETILMGMLYGGQHEFRGHGADPPHVSDPRGRHQALERLQRSAFYPVCMPLYRYLYHLPYRWQQSLQTYGDQEPDRFPEADQSLYRREHFQERGECQPTHDHRL